MMLGFKRVKEDGMYNRRRMTVLLMIGSVIWAITILICDVIYEFSTTEILAYLGFVTTLAGIPTWGYIKACSDEDKENEDQ